MASTKQTAKRRLPTGEANPSVVTEDPLISNERWTVPESIPQKMNENPTMTESIQTRGRLTSAMGA